MTQVSRIYAAEEVARILGSKAFASPKRLFSPLGMTAANIFAARRAGVAPTVPGAKASKSATTLVDDDDDNHSPQNVARQEVSGFFGSKSTGSPTARTFALPGMTSADIFASRRANSKGA
ncbi:hypothetical protein ACIQUB_08325 [Rhizobium sp. NPDC090275]|uniref:hypothetical protein n=1 Tax=Rhizobium sp. NPDC090275 TaxID=3364498 RepID=UPI00383B4462